MNTGGIIGRDKILKHPGSASRSHPFRANIIFNAQWHGHQGFRFAPRLREIRGIKSISLGDLAVGQRPPLPQKNALQRWDRIPVDLFVSLQHAVEWWD